MADFGMKVSRPGYDVKTCADRELMYSTSWPLMKIHSHGAVTIADTGAQTIATHSLGYYPMFIVMVDSLWEAWGGVPGAEIIMPGISQYIGVTTSVLKWTGAAGAGLGAFDIYYYIFTDDLTNDFTADNVQTTDTTEDTGADFGVKAVVDGKDVWSTDYRDYAVHSGVRSATLHMVESGSTAGVGTLTVTHNLGYRPVYFLYGKQSGNDFYQLFGNADDSTVTLDTTKLECTTALGAAWDYSVVILKDNIRVT